MGRTRRCTSPSLTRTRRGKLPHRKDSGNSKSCATGSWPSGNRVVWSMAWPVLPMGIAQRLAAVASEVYVLVAGIPVPIHNYRLGNDQEKT